MKRDSDEQHWARLMVSAQSGNESDYRCLLTELTAVIYHFLRSRFGNQPFIEDCVQESLIAIHQARHTYDPHRPFRPWLFAIVRHKAIDTLRSQSRRKKAADDYHTEQEVLSPASLHNETESELCGGDILVSLPPPHREALILTKFIGYSIAETAKKLSISESAVKVRVHRAIHKLQQILEADEQ